MYKILTQLFVFLILIACSKNNDFEKNEVNLTSESIDIQIINTPFIVEDIDFIDNKTGYVINNTGQILNTENSGLDWNLLYQSNYQLLDIQFRTKQYGYVLAKVKNKQSYFLLKTSDYGKSFQELPIPKGSGLNKIYFTTNDIGLVLGNRVLKTVDNGSNWIELSPDYFFLTDIVEKNNGELYACGGNGTFLKSANKGIDWIKIDLQVNSIQIKSFQDIFYTIGGGSITKINKKKTQEFDKPAYINDFHIYDEEIIIGFGNQYPEKGYFPSGAIFISNNSGKDWETTLLGEYNRINVVDFIDSSNGFGIADNIFGQKQYLMKIKIEF